MNEKLFQTLSRGPLLLCFSTVTFLFPIIQAIKRNITHDIITACVFLIFGLYYTIKDYGTFIKIQIEQMKKKIQIVSSKIVLDSTLRDIFSLDADTGLLGCTTASFVSIVGLYTIPFSKDHRAMLLQSILPSSMDARKILFMPGGFWDCLLPDKKWRNIVLGGSGSRNGNNNERVEGQDEKEEEDDSHHRDTTTGYLDENVLNDLSWDNETETDSSTEVGPSMNSLTPTTVITNDETTNSSTKTQQYSSVTDTIIQNQNSTQQPRISMPTQSHATISTTTTTSSPSPTTGLDPIETLQLITTNALGELCNSILQKVNNDQVRGVGILATMTLLIQLKTSPSARRMVWNTLHISTTFSLVGVIMSSLTTLKIKQCMSMGLGTGTGRNIYPKDSSQNENESHSNNIPSERRINTNGRSTSTSRGENQQRLQKLAFIPVRKIISDLLNSLRNSDGKLKRQYQGILAFIVWYYFQKKSKKKTSRKIL